jgi:hypothetical protein
VALEARQRQLCHHREIGMTMLRDDDNSNRLGQQTASSASPPAATGRVEGSKPAAGRTWKQRMTAASVGGFVILLLKLVGWLSTPTHHTALSLPPGTYLPPATSLGSAAAPSLPPGINHSPTANWGSATVPALPHAMNPPSNVASDGRAAYLRDDNATRNKPYQSLGKCGKLFPTGRGAVPGINCTN